MDSFDICLTMFFICNIQLDSSLYLLISLTDPLPSTVKIYNPFFQFEVFISVFLSNVDE